MSERKLESASVLLERLMSYDVSIAPRAFLAMVNIIQANPKICTHPLSASEAFMCGAIFGVLEELQRAYRVENAT